VALLRGQTVANGAKNPEPQVPGFCMSDLNGAGVGNAFLGIQDHVVAFQKHQIAFGHKH